MNHKRVLLYLILIGFCIMWLLPVVGILISSFKPETEILEGVSPLAPPENGTLGNYENILFEEGNPPLATAFRNSALIIPFSILGSVFIGALAAYPLSRLKFRGNFFFYMFLVFAMMLPFQLVMIPVRDAAYAMGIGDNLIGVIFAHIVFGVPFCAFILRNFFKGVPKSLQDAARIDGCSHFSFFWKILLPLAFPALAVLALLQFTGIYNDVLWALVIFGTRTGLNPVPASLLTAYGGGTGNLALLCAGSFLAMVPTLLLFVILQKYFLKGLAVVER